MVLVLDGVIMEHIANTGSNVNAPDGTAGVTECLERNIWCLSCNIL